MIYARQVAPEYQNSDFELEAYTTGEQRINVWGNSRYISYTSEGFDRVNDAISEGLEDMLNDPAEYGYQNVTDVIMDYLPPVKERYTSKDIHDLHLLFTDMDAYAEQNGVSYEYLDENFLCEVLSIVYGEKWTCDVIRGSAQGDWNNVFYPAAAFTEKNIEQFETLYFNEGTEWIVSDDMDEEPNSIEEIYSMNVYCCAWDADGIKEEIADACGVSANEVKLYAFSRWARMPVYEAV